MKIHVTGATGFIGQHLVPLLKSQGHTVYPLYFDQATFLNIEPDVCIHLAWRGYAGSGGPEENLDSLKFGIETLKTLRELGCQRFVGVGTCFEYAPAHSPLSEWSPLAASGTNPFYSRCKLVFREVAESYCETVGMAFAWARIFNCYGPGESSARLVPSIIAGLLTKQPVPLTAGDQVRDYLHVADVASALATIATSDLQGAVNVCSGVGVSVRELAEQITRGAVPLQFGAKPYRLHDPMMLVGDSTRLRNRGWAPAVSLRDGIADSIAYWGQSV